MRTDDGNSIINARPNLRVAFFFTALVFVIFALNLIRMQIVEKEKYFLLSTRNIVYKERIKAQRGVIKDRHGEVIAGNKQSYDLYIMPFVARKDLLGLKASLVKAGIVFNTGKYKNNRENLIARNIGYEKYVYIQVNKDEFPFLFTKEAPLRNYPFGAGLYYPLGYVSLATPAEIKENAAEDDYTGKTGMERTYDPVLRGEDGIEVLIKDAYGTKKELTPENVGDKNLLALLLKGKKEVIHGRDMDLTLSMKLQKFIYDKLKDLPACAMVMDVSTGELLAFISTPCIDPNLFLEGISDEIWENILKDEKNPLFNKALNLYSPASTFKPFTALAGMYFGIPEILPPCRGSVEMHNVEKHCWKEEGHGTQNISEAIRNSCNVYFYQAGDLVGIERMHEFAKYIGLTGTTGQKDLADEEKPVIPDLKYKFRNKILDGRWYPAETLDAAIGQGLVQVTPVKMLQLYAFLATGFMPVPHLVKADLISAPSKPEVNEDMLAKIRKGLRDSVNAGGTSWRAHSTLIEICGKTGTMQTKKIKEYFRKLSPDQQELPYADRDSGWFVSFAPYGKPEYCMAVFVEHHGSGGYFPAMISKDIYEFMKKEGYFGD